jgi:hypothetical protein
MINRRPRVGGLQAQARRPPNVVAISRGNIPRNARPGRDLIYDRRIAALYARLRVITVGPIWRWERWKQILGLAHWPRQSPRATGDRSRRARSARSANRTIAGAVEGLSG